MHVATAVHHPFASRLAFGAAQPPRAAVLALFTLVPTPVDLLSVAEWEEPGGNGPAAWTLIGLDAGGIVIVRATAGPGAAADVHSARWHPMAHVRCVGVEAVEVSDTASDDGDIEGRLSWLLRIEGEGELHLPDPDGPDDARAGEFCRRVQDLLRAPREG